MYGILPTKRFKRSLERLKKSGLFKIPVKDTLDEVTAMLAEGTPLPPYYADHRLSGEMRAYRECHIRGDLLLVYERLDDKQIILLTDIGSHSHIFG